MSPRFAHLEFDDGNHATVPLREEEQRDADYYLDQATQAFEAEAFANALKLFARVLEFDPAQPRSWYGQIRSLIELHRLDEALGWATQALEQYPTDRTLMALKAIPLARLGQREEALAFSDAANNPEAPTEAFWLSRAEVFIHIDVAAAEYALETALAASPSDWQLAWLASRMRHFHTHHAAALKLATVAMERAPTHATPWLALARSQIALGLSKPAQDSLARAAELAPDSPVITQLRTDSAPKGRLAHWLQRFRLRA